MLKCFKSSDTLDKPPQNLYLMTAILIREGLLLLEDIYPHVSTIVLSPLDF